MKNFNKSSFKLNVIANYIGRSWAAILGIVLIPLYISFLGIEAYGLVGFYAALFSVMGLLNFGIGTTVNRELARFSTMANQVENSRDLVRTLEIIYWLIALFSAVLIVVIAPFIANSWISTENLDPKTVTETVQLMGISIAFRFPLALYQGGLMGMQKQVLVNTILIITGTLRGVGAVLVLWLISSSIQAYFVWQVIISLLGSILFYIAIWKNLPKSKTKPKFNFKIINRIWKYAAAISVSAIMGIILSQLDKIILSKMLTLREFAYYSIAATAASIIWMFITPFNSAVFPKLVQKHEEKDNAKLVDFFHTSSQSLSLIVIPAASILIFYSKEILNLWIGDSDVISNSFHITSLLAFGILLNGLAQIPTTCAQAFGWPSLITYTNFLQSLIIVPLIIALTYYFKGIGAAIAWIVMNSTYILFMIPIFFKKYLNSEIKEWYIYDIIIPLMVSMGICFLSKLIYPVFDSKIQIAIWIIISSFIALLATGFSLNRIKKILITKIDFKNSKKQFYDQ